MQDNNQKPRLGTVPTHGVNANPGMMPILLEHPLDEASMAAAKAGGFPILDATDLDEDGAMEMLFDFFKSSPAAEELESRQKRENGREQEEAFAEGGDDEDDKGDQDDDRFLRERWFFISGEMGLSLHRTGHEAFLLVDFGSGNINYRARHMQFEPIVKAMRLKEFKYVWDATAGLGTDSFIMAGISQVEMFERHPVPHLLLTNAIERAKLLDDVGGRARNMRLNFGSIMDMDPKEIANPPEAIYLDPMFVHARRKVALSKKGMNFFQSIIGADEDQSLLLEKARRIATSRVVLKRPNDAPLLTSEKPNFQLQGKTVRYDVYLPLR